MRQGEWLGLGKTHGADTSQVLGSGPVAGTVLSTFQKEVVGYCNIDSTTGT